jgi:hypothetical protein
MMMSLRGSWIDIEQFSTHRPGMWLPENEAATSGTSTPYDLPGVCSRNGQNRTLSYQVRSPNKMKQVLFIHPPTACDHLIMHHSNVGDWPAKVSEAQTEKETNDFAQLLLIDGHDLST